MDLSPENLTKGHVYLCDMVGLLTCRFCDHFLNNAISLPCLHRFCERCVSKKLEQEKKKAQCPTCLLKFDRSDIRQQSQLNMYISSLKKMFDLLHKVDNSSAMDDLYDYVMNCKSWSELNHTMARKLGDSETNVQQNTSNDQTIIENDDMEFEPQLSSTVYKMPRDSSFIEDMTNLDSGDIVVDETKIDQSMDEIYNVPTQDDTSEKENLTTTIEELSQVEMTPPDSMRNDETTTNNDSQEMPCFSSQEEINTIRDEITELINTSDSNTYQTQSQYHVLRQPITYSHKTLDKFDQIIQRTANTSTEFDLTESSKAKPESCKPQVESSPQNSRLNSSAYSLPRSDSPELDLFGDLDDEYNDDELMLGIY